MASAQSWTAPKSESLSSLPQVRGALSAVREDLTGDKQREEAWREYLALDPLEEQVQKGADASPSTVAKSIDSLSKTERPVNRERMVALRDALSEWLDGAEPESPAAEAKDASEQKELSFPDREKSPDDESDEESDSDEDAPELSEEGAEAVQEAVTELRSWIGRDKPHYQQWESILRLREIERAAKSHERADVERVRELRNLITRETDHLDRTAYVRLRRALQYWQAELETPLGEKLAKQTRNAKRSYVPIQANRLSGTRVELSNALQELDRFLNTGEGRYNKGWRKFLELKELRQEISEQSSPRVRPLVTSFARFNSGEPGLELREFVAVRDVLQEYLELLQLSETESGRLLSGRREFLEGTKSFDRFLKSGGDRKENGWKRYLDWKALESQLAEDPDEAVLRDIYKKLQDEEVSGLDRAPFQRLSVQLAKYLELLQLSRGVEARDLFDSRLEQLALTLEEHQLDPDNDTAARLNTELGWLSALGVIPEVSAGIHRQFSLPNVHLSLSGDFLMEQINDTVNDAQAVNQCFEGSRVRGCARTNATVRGVLVPSENGIVIDIQMTGVTRTQAVAQQRRVYVNTRGETQLSANKRLFISLQGMSTSPAVAVANTCQQVTGVCIDRRSRVGKRLIRRVAHRRAAESRQRAECLQSQQAETAIADRMDDQVRDMISQSNGRIQKLLDRLNIDEEYLPDDIHTRSTHRRVLANAIVTAKKYLAAPSEPPNVGAESDLALQLHQSAVNNLLARMLGGIKLDNDRLVQMLEEFDLEVPDELKKAGSKTESAESSNNGTSEDEEEEADEEEDEEEADEEDWSLTFDLLQPATITFFDGKFRVGIRGRKFTQGDQGIDEPIEISATYRLRKTPNKELEAVRIGEVDVQFVKSPGRLSTKQLAYKTFIKRKTAVLFARRFSTDDLPPGELADRLKSLKLDHVEATRGWIALAFGLQNVSLDGFGADGNSTPSR